MRINKKTIFFVLVIFVAILFFYQREITHTEGVLVSDQPLQQEIVEGDRRLHNLKKGIVAESLAKYKIKARILSTNRYWLDLGASVSPIDLALGWGPMSDSQNLNKLSISQSLRYYHIRWSEAPPISATDIMQNSANVHIIPANELLKKSFLNLRKGHLIEMSGELVVVSSQGRGEWRSSLSRDDTGAGACELMYVESLKILNEGH